MDIDDADLVVGLRASDVDRLVYGATEVLDAEQRLRAAFDAESDAERRRGLEAVGTALMYRLVRPGESDAAVIDGIWGPLMRLTDGTQIPPRLEELDEAIVDIWERASAVCTQPLVVARVAHLCWTLRRKPRPDLHARRAVDAYLTLASTPRDEFEGLRQADDAGCALHIARELRDEGLATKAESALLAVATRDLESSEPAPGISLRALQPLIDTCAPEHEAEVLSLAMRAVDVFSNDPWAYESANDLLGRLLAPQEREALREAVVKNWTAVADATAGIVGFAHRQHALELAKTFGMSEVADAIRVALQQQDAESLGMQHIRHEGELAGVEEMIESLVADSFITTLFNLTAYGPPSGDPERNRQAVEEERRVAPLQAFLPRTLLGVANSTVWHAPAGTPERDRYDLARTEQFRISYTMAIFDIVLREALARFGPPTREDLIKTLTTEFIPPAVAAPLADAVLAMLAGDIDAGVNVALPRIESIVRELVRRSDRPITQEPRGTAPGGVRALGALLDDLRDLIDEGWRRYLVNALVDPLGMNLRNRALHGLLDVPSAQDAVMVMHIIALLAGLSGEAAEPGTGHE